MLTKDFYFELPSELIAKHPLEKRDLSRLLHYNPKTQTIKHLNFKDITGILNRGDLLVINNTKVLPARLFLKKKNDNTGKQIEVLLLKPKISEKENGSIWEIMGKPFKRLKSIFEYELENGLEVSIIEEDNKKYLDFHSLDNFKKAISDAGNMPIPPYMKRAGADEDKERYQTIYAKDENQFSVAAPTAGLHFTDEVFKALREKGVEIIELTLHVGPGTFLPIKSENIKDHKMMAEDFEIKKEDLNKILKAKNEGKRVVGVGSTSSRCLESLEIDKKYDEDLIKGSTDIYIYPGYKFKMIDAMLTNFHLPESTLILLVSAFTSKDEVMDIYKEAIKEQYRFYSYGDCMLVY